METNSTSKVFFLKVILSNAFIVGGKPVPFEPIPGNEGVIALDPKENNDLITALSNAAANQKGGVVRISEAEYTQKKTAAALKPSAPRSRDALRPMRNALSPFNMPTTAAKGAQPVSSSPAVGATAPETTAPAAAQAGPAAEAATPATEGVVFRPAVRRISRKDAVPAD
jgi:hypothetical protein